MCIKLFTIIETLNFSLLLSSYHKMFYMAYNGRKKTNMNKRACGPFTWHGPDENEVIEAKY